jgi:hypothetical protein
MDFKGVSNILNKYGRQITESIKTRLKQDGTYATGRSHDSVVYKVTDTTLEISFDKSVESISKGTKRVRPSTTAIMAWMDAKGIKGREKKTGRFTSKKKAAYAIATSIFLNGTIKRFGYKGTGVLDFAFSDTIQTQLLDELAIEFIKEASDELLNTLRKNGFTNK